MPTAIKSPLSDYTVPRWSCGMCPLTFLDQTCGKTGWVQHRAGSRHTRQGSPCTPFPSENRHTGTLDPPSPQSSSQASVPSRSGPQRWSTPPELLIAVEPRKITGQPGGISIELHDREIPRGPGKDDRISAPSFISRTISSSCCSSSFSA